MVAGLLAALGMKLFDNYAENVVVSGVKKVTGIDLDKKTELTADEIERIKKAEFTIGEELKQILIDKQNARLANVAIQNSDTGWLVKNTGSMIALMIIIAVFGLFGLLLNGQLDIANSNVALIAGFSGGYVSSVIAFYFGSSKNESDKSKESS